MYLLFEKFNNIDSYLMSRLMVFAVKGQWVHCEIIFDEKDNLRASAWNKNGVEFRNWKPLINEHYFELYPLPSEHWEAVYQFFQQYEGSEYDKVGILGMMYGIGFLNSEKKFCSELCYEIVQNYTPITLPAILPGLVSPLSLRRMLLNQGIQPVPLSVLNKH